MRPAGIYVGLSLCTIALVATLAMDGSVRRRPQPGQRGRLGQVGEVGDESAEAQTKAEQYAQARLAPGVVLPGAYSAAFASLSGLPVAGSSWTEVTNRPYDADDARYRDPFASNSSGGAGLVSGRITGLAAGSGYLFIGGANGGVFRSGNNGQTWTPMTDGMPALSTGDLRLAPDGALWFATGEANTGATAFLGTGVYRLASPLLRVVLGRPIASAARNSKARSSASFGSTASATCMPRPHAASGSTPRRRSPERGSACSIPCRTPWWTAFRGPTCSSPTTTSATTSQFSREGMGRMCSSTARGATARRTTVSTIRPMPGRPSRSINPKGALNPQDVGRTSFAYASDGSRLYALVESMTKYTNSNQTALGGIYVSPTGNPAGPWNKIASSGNLGTSMLGAPEFNPLQTRNPGLVQPVPRGRSRRRESCVRRSRGGLRDGGRRRPLDDDRPLLEFRIQVLVGLRQPEHLPEDDASRISIPSPSMRAPCMSATTAASTRDRCAGPSTPTATQPIGRT